MHAAMHGSTLTGVHARVCRCERESVLRASTRVQLWGWCVSLHAEHDPLLSRVQQVHVPRQLGPRGVCAQRVHV